MICLAQGPLQSFGCLCSIYQRQYMCIHVRSCPFKSIHLHSHVPMLSYWSISIARNTILRNFPLFRFKVGQVWIFTSLTPFPLLLITNALPVSFRRCAIVPLSMSCLTASLASQCVLKRDRAAAKCVTVQQCSSVNEYYSYY